MEGDDDDDEDDDGACEMRMFPDKTRVVKIKSGEEVPIHNYREIYKT